MKNLSLFMLIVMLVFLGTIAFSAEPGASGEQEVGNAEVGVPPSLTASVPNQNAKEVQIPTATDFNGRDYMDEHILALSESAQAIIQTLAAEIEQLDDRSDEGKLQKKIEKIKHEEEITRLHIQLELVKDGEDQKLAAEIEEEIAHLGTINQPVIGTPKEQPASEPKMGIGDEEVIK